MSMTHVERMIHVRNVAWGRDPEGDYWVQWSVNGEHHETAFKMARSAENFVRWLDTTGEHLTVQEVKEAEKSLRELEEAVEEFDEPPREDVRAAQRSLRGLERTMKRLDRPVRVRRHRRST